jgi:hypothetical protein
MSPWQATGVWASNIEYSNIFAWCLACALKQACDAGLCRQASRSSLWSILSSVVIDAACVVNTEQFVSHCRPETWRRMGAGATAPYLALVGGPAEGAPAECEALATQTPYRPGDDPGGHCMHGPASHMARRMPPPSFTGGAAHGSFSHGSRLRLAASE